MISNIKDREDTVFLVSEIQSVNKEFMEQGGPSAPPLRDTYERADDVDYNWGHIPRRAFTDYRESHIEYKPKGKRQQFEKPIQFQTRSDGLILNLSAQDPQTWTSVLEIWKNAVIYDYMKYNKQETTAEEMLRVLETYLGESTKAVWEAYKQTHPNQGKEMLALGQNPYNFVNKISWLLASKDPNIGSQQLQEDALRKLEQLQLKDWKYIKPFLQDFFYLTTVSGNTFNREISEKIFTKLPGPLGLQIAKNWRESQQQYQGEEAEQLINIGVMSQFIIEQLQDICTKIQIQKQLKQGYGFCSQIYTAQHYGDKESRHKKHNKSYKHKHRKHYIPKKKYYIRRSQAKKPFLRKERHVRRFNPNRTYKRKLQCYACGDDNHLSPNCPKRQNMRNKEALLIDCVNEDIIAIDQDMSDNESIYSIESIEIRSSEIDSSEEDIGLIDELVPLDELDDLGDLELLKIDNTLTDYISTCTHDLGKAFEFEKGIDSNPCFYCKNYPHQKRRAQCSECFREICLACLKLHFNIEKPIQHFQDKNLLLRINILENQYQLLTNRVSE